MRAKRGVNLGGWLILERWMTPTLFSGTDAIDEYTFMQTSDARAKLRAHQREFICEEDFKWMSQNGIELVRIPIGYWILDGDGPFVSCIGRLDWAMSMAQKYRIGVLICMHGASGSQNGRDHSGRVGKTHWYGSHEHQERTITTLTLLAQRYARHPALWGIELLNEPRTKLLQGELKRYYRAAYRAVARVVRPGVVIVFHDAFMPRMLSGAVGEDVRFPTMIDIHWYHFAFWLKRLMPLRWYFGIVMPLRRRLIRRLRRVQGVIIGEWNGIIAGELLDRYPKVRHDDIIREHIARQMIDYGEADAWFYWNYKTEARGVWHFRSMVEDGLLDMGQ